MNTRLVPFGQSKALDASTDIIPGTGVPLVSGTGDMSDFFTGYDTDGGNLSSGSAECFEPYAEGDTLRVYVPANMQGVLLPSNTNPDNKTADAVTAAGGNPDLCTYLEIYGTAQGFAQMNGNVAYKFFLGGDNTSDFSVESGHALAVTFTPTEAGITRQGDWWKVEKNLTAAVPDVYTLKIDPQSKTISSASGSGTVAVTCTKNGSAYTGWTVSGDDSKMTASKSGSSVRWSVSGLNGGGSSSFTVSVGDLEETFTVTRDDVYEAENVVLSLDGLSRVRNMNWTGNLSVTATIKKNGVSLGDQSIPFSSNYITSTEAMGNDPSTSWHSYDYPNNGNINVSFLQGVSGVYDQCVDVEFRVSVLGVYSNSINIFMTGISFETGESFRLNVSPSSQIYSSSSSGVTPTVTLIGSKGTILSVRNSDCSWKYTTNCTTLGDFCMEHHMTVDSNGRPTFSQLPCDDEIHQVYVSCVYSHDGVTYSGGYDIIIPEITSSDFTSVEYEVVDIALSFSRYFICAGSGDTISCSVNLTLENKSDRLDRREIYNASLSTLSFYNVNGSVSSFGDANYDFGTITESFIRSCNPSSAYPITIRIQAECNGISDSAIISIEEND